MISAQPKSF